MGRMFGTDGVRGIANADLSCELAMKIGAAGAYVLTSVHNPRILVGQDTRKSGDMLACALSAGICSIGGDVINVGRHPYARNGIPCAAVFCGCRRYDKRIAQHNGIQRHKMVRWRWL